MPTITPISKESDNPESLSELNHLVGTTLDQRFRLEAAVGQGAMGTVFLATQLSVSRRVAVKLLREHVAQVGRSRFLREAQVISAMSHPNIVQMIDFGETENGILYLAMEFIEGMGMSRLVRRRRLHPSLATEIAIQICSALAEAHAHGIIHRDLKPSNMLVVRRADGSIQVKVLDFGIAYTSEASADLTAAGALCGTPAYMSPEQARGKRATAASDLYALGLVFYEMIAGFRPFTGETAMQILMSQVHNRPPTLRPFVEEGLLPAPVVRIVEELLEKDPDRRPASASEVRQRLLRIRQQLDWSPLVLTEEGDAGWEAWGGPPLGRHGSSTMVHPAPTERTLRLDSENTANMAIAPADRSARPPEGSTVRHVTVRGLQDLSLVDASRGASPDESAGPSRHGGGWDAFRGMQTATGLGVGAVVDPNLLTAESGASSLLGAPADETGRLSPATHDEPEPEAIFQSLIETAGASYDSLVQPKTEAAQLPKLADVQNLVVERPPRPSPIVEPQNDGLAVSPVRLVLVALLAFAVVGGIGWGYLALREGGRKAAPPAAELEVAEEQTSPAEVEKEKKPAPQRRKKKRDPSEPIPLFDVPPGDGEGDGSRKIIIEEAK